MQSEAGDNFLYQRLLVGVEIFYQEELLLSENYFDPTVVAD